MPGLYLSRHPVYEFSLLGRKGCQNCSVASEPSSYQSHMSEVFARVSLSCQDEMGGTDHSFCGGVIGLRQVTAATESTPRAAVYQIVIISNQ